VLACHRYIELNPMRAATIRQAQDDPWSSYACNALGGHKARVAPHHTWLGRGATAGA